VFARWLLASLHLLALAIGAGGIWARTVALRSERLDAAELARVFRADTFWGIAAGLWLVTGLLRAFAGFEKGTEYYLSNHLFLTKMVLFLLVVALEIKPMVTLIRWRRAVARGDAVDASSAPALARISLIQSHVLVVMILLAAALARGVGGQG
jgi:putative membrane protein